MASPSCPGMCESRSSSLPGQRLCPYPPATLLPSQPIAAPPPPLAPQPCPRTRARVHRDVRWRPAYRRPGTAAPACTGPRPQRRCLALMTSSSSRHALASRMPLSVDRRTGDRRVPVATIPHAPITVKTFSKSSHPQRCRRHCLFFASASRRLRRRNSNPEGGTCNSRHACVVARLGAAHVHGARGEGCVARRRDEPWAMNP